MSLPPLAALRLNKHRNFLSKFRNDPTIPANKTQISMLCEICFNADKIPLNKSAYALIMKNLPIVRHIGKCRKEEKARELIDRFGSLFLPALVKACCSNATLGKI